MLKNSQTNLDNKSILNRITYPADIRELDIESLIQLSNEVRKELIESVSQTGGHLGAGLGVVELTIALHYVFNTPYDRLIWDVGHQTYPHKILTGRKDKIRTLRQSNGLSGFTKRSESEYDPFGAAHSSTSISSALGIATANKLNNKSNKIFIDYAHTPDAIKQALMALKLHFTDCCRSFQNEISK